MKKAIDLVGQVFGRLVLDSSSDLHVYFKREPHGAIQPLTLEDRNPVPNAQQGAYASGAIAGSSAKW